MGPFALRRQGELGEAGGGASVEEAQENLVRGGPPQGMASTAAFNRNRFSGVYAARVLSLRPPRSLSLSPMATPAVAIASFAWTRKL